MTFTTSTRVLLSLLALVVVLNMTTYVRNANSRAMEKSRTFPLILVDQDLNRPTQTTSTTTAPGTTDLTEDSRRSKANVMDAENDEQQKKCPLLPPDLGPIFRKRDVKEWISDLLEGGHFKSPKCRAVQAIALIVPHRCARDYGAVTVLHSGPKEDLSNFLYNLHPFLMKQQAEYQVFVIEYANDASNVTRGYLFNVGFRVAMYYRRWDCLVFHEPDLVPKDTRNLYRCTRNPKMLVENIEFGIINIGNHSSQTFGQVLAMTPQQFLKLNGFSNSVSGSLAEYFNIYKRVQKANYLLEKTVAPIGNYQGLGLIRKNLYNEESTVSTSPNNDDELNFKVDGVNTVSYEVMKRDYLPLYTNIKLRKSVNTRGNNR